MSLRHSGWGLDLRTFPDAPGNEHEAQSAHRARPTRQLPNGRGETGIGVPSDEDADGALRQQRLQVIPGVQREDALTGIEHERAQGLGLRKAERDQTDAVASGAPQPFTPRARAGEQVELGEHPDHDEEVKCSRAGCGGHGGLHRLPSPPRGQEAQPEQHEEQRRSPRRGAGRRVEQLPRERHRMVAPGL